MSLHNADFQQLNDLHHEVSVRRASIPYIVDMFFGQAAFGKGPVPHNLAEAWVLDVLRMTICRWTQTHDDIVRATLSIQTDIYVACRG